MKKRNLKTLNLNKNSVSSLDSHAIVGGTDDSCAASCTNYSDFASCNGICYSFLCDITKTLQPPWEQ